MEYVMQGLIITVVQYFVYMFPVPRTVNVTRAILVIIVPRRVTMKSLVQVVHIHRHLVTRIV